MKLMLIYNISSVQIHFWNILCKAQLKIHYKIKSKENITWTEYILVYCTLASNSFISLSKAIHFSNNSPDQSSVFREKNWRTLFNSHQFFQTKKLTSFSIFFLSYQQYFELPTQRSKKPPPPHNWVIREIQGNN